MIQQPSRGHRVGSVNVRIETDPSGLIAGMQKLQEAFAKLGTSTTAVAEAFRNMMIVGLDLPDPVPSYHRPFLLRMFSGRMVDFR